MKKLLFTFKPRAYKAVIGILLIVCMISITLFLMGKEYSPCLIKCASVGAFVVSGLLLYVTSRQYDRQDQEQSKLIFIATILIMMLALTCEPKIVLKDSLVTKEVYDIDFDDSNHTVSFDIASEGTDTDRYVLSYDSREEYYQNKSSHYQNIVDFGMESEICQLHLINYTDGSLDHRLVCANTNKYSVVK